MIKLDFDVPDWRLELREDERALRAAAEKLAEGQRARLDSGTSSSGAPTPAAKDKARGAEPLERTGALRASIQARVENGVALAGPTGDRARVAAILASPGKRTNRPARDPWTPTPADEDAAVDAYERIVELDLVER